MNLIGQNSFLIWLLGEDATREGVPQLQWTNMPESWGVFVLIAVVLAIAAAVVWMYLNEIDSCPLPVKILLGFLRFSVLMMLVVMFLNPSISFVQTHAVKPNIGFARDASLSYSRKDSYKDAEVAGKLAGATGWSAEDIMAGTYSRAELFHQAMNANDRKITELMRDRGSLRIVDFSEVVTNRALIPARTGDVYSQPSEQNDQSGNDTENSTAGSPENNQDRTTDEADEVKQTNVMPALIAAGRETDIWQVLRELLNDSNRLSAIVIGSDGQHNGSEQDVLELAREAAKKNIPIFTIGVGDPSRPRNISVTDVYVRDKAQPNEPFEIEALFYAEDVQESDVEVELIQQELDGSGQVASETSIATEKLPIVSGGRLRLNFQQTVRVPGQFSYVVKVQQVDGENETSDNQLTSSVVSVVDEKVKVLLIAGSPTWEYRLVQRLLQRDSMISLSCWLQTMDPDRSQEGNEPIAEFPNSIEQLGRYNVVMLFDPDPQKDFDEDWVDAIQQFCKRNAGGLMYMSGPKFTNMFMTLNRLRKFKNMLPVKFGDENFFDIAQADLMTSDIQQSPGRMLIVKHNLDHPVMSFSKDLNVNGSLWAKMPSILWSYPTMSAKPASRVLMERGDSVSEKGNQPLLVAGRYGAGNILYMGFNGTWRWRRVGLQAQYFDRFWIQTVRYLIETRSLQGSRRGFIDADRSDYELGNKVTLIAQIDDERFQPLKDPTVQAIVRSQDGTPQQIELKATPGQEGSYEASFFAQRIGTFEVSVNLPGADDETGIEPVQFRVQPPSVESQSYWLNEKFLRDIAQASGGKYYTLDQLESLAKDLPIAETKTEYNSPPQPIWDIHPPFRYLVFLLPFLLLTIEWAIRKKCRLL